MTEVAFHFGAPDKVAYACRLLRKAFGSGAKVAVLAEPSLCDQLDADLWTLGAVDFVPHCQDTSSESVQRHSPLLLSSNLELVPSCNDQVLVQLVHPLPNVVQSFRRVIEVVTLDEADRALARQRWKAYAAVGVPIQRHDLALKE